MVHANSLRIIGQALELTNATVFELEKHGQYYVTWSASLDADKWISYYGLAKNSSDAGARELQAHCSLCFKWSDISRLDSQANKRRRHQASSYVQNSNKLPQLLRTVGDYLDRNAISAFHLSWTPELVYIVTLPVNDLVVERFQLTAEKLQQLSLHTRLRRSKPHVLPSHVNKSPFSAAALAFFMRELVGKETIFTPLRFAKRVREIFSTLPKQFLTCGGFESG